jgi:hypothetical protein
VILLTYDTGQSRVRLVLASGRQAESGQGGSLSVQDQTKTSKGRRIMRVSEAMTAAGINVDGQPVDEAWLRAQCRECGTT